MLTQHRHLPQALIGESVEVVGPILPPGPTLGPSSLDQLIWQDKWDIRAGDRWYWGKSEDRYVPGSSGDLEVVDGERGGPWEEAEPEGGTMVAASPFTDPWLLLDISAVHHNHVDLTGRDRFSE